MTIAILKKTTSQKIARPCTRACSFDEAIELLVSIEYGDRSYAERKEAMDRAASLPEEFADALGVNWKNLDTDRPIVRLRSGTFYAFTEGK